MRTVVAMLLVILLSTVARAGAPGTLIITSEKVDMTGKFDAALKKAQVKSVDKKDDGWHLYFVAFLKKSAPAGEVNLVFYDAADKSKEPTNAFAIATAAGTKILTSEISLGVDQGFKSGHTYNVMIARLVGGKEDVYARTTLLFK